MSLVSRETLVRFEQLLRDKHMEIRGRLHKERRGDRANVSAAWNAYIKGLGGSILRGKGDPDTHRKPLQKDIIFRELVDLVNFKNERISGKVMVGSPDRVGQWMLIPSDVVERTLVLGLP